MIIVLSGLRTKLEDSLVGKGADVGVVVPRKVYVERMAESRRYSLYEIDNWTDYSALTSLAAQLEPLDVENVVTVDEPAVRAAAFLRSLLGIPGQCLHDAVGFTDKSVMKRRLTALGVPVAPHKVVFKPADVPAAAQDLGWPVVVKPRDGLGVINTFFIQDLDHFSELLESGSFEESKGKGIPAGMLASGVAQALADRPFGFMVEKAVRDVVAEYHCEVLIVDGREQYCIPARYEVPLLRATDGSIGSVILANSEKRQRVAELARRAAHALNLMTGFAHCEILESSDGRLTIGEIACRPGGAQIPHLLKLQYGLDVFSLAADIALDAPLSVTLTPQSGTVAWRSLPSPRGRIVDMTDVSAIKEMPDVVDAICSVRIGDTIHGFQSSLSAVAHVFCVGDNEDAAQRRAAEVAKEWRFKCA